MPGLIDKIYAKSPVFMQNIGISVYGYAWRARRLGGNFKILQESFTEREKFSYSDWSAYQERQLRILLNRAEKYTRFYNQMLRRLAIRPADLQDFTIDDLKHLPLLEKNHLRSQPNEFLASDIKSNKLHTYHTSGTTGAPVAIRMTSETHRKSAASYEARVRMWAGLNYRMRRVMIGGRLVVPRGHASPPYWRYNAAEQQLYMSAFHISPDNAVHYAHAINKFRPDYLVGYASSHYFLARMILEQGIQVVQPRAVLVSSEKLTDEMRMTIQQAYRCKVFDGYSGVEACCLASECEHGHMHISPDVGLIEILDETGRSVEPGGIGEIVATGFLNQDQPLVRFRTGDLASVLEINCDCGRQMPIIEDLVGRLEDTVVGKDGRETVRFHGIFVGLPHIREGQVVQKDYTEFELRLVVDPGFSDADVNIIQKRFDERLGPVNVKITFVDQIDRTDRGKFKAVISEVDRKPKTTFEND